MKTLLLLCSACLYAAYPAVDYFHRPDSSSLGANWNQAGAYFDIQSLGIRAVGSDTTKGIEWVGDSAPANDQFSIAVLDSPWNAKASGVNGGVAIRYDATAGNGYYCHIDVVSTGTFRLLLGRVAANVKTGLTTGSGSALTLSAGARLRLWAVGTSINCILVDSTGATQLSTVSATDSTYTSGRVGVHRTTQNVAFAAWFGGDGTGATAIPYNSSYAVGNYFISATATNAGATGTVSDPWPYLNFFADQGRLPCGSTLWVRGGTYTTTMLVYKPSGGLFELSNDCASNTATTYRVYGMESVVFDAQYDCNSQTAVGEQVMLVSGDYSILEGGYNQWRFTNSNNACKVITQCGSNPTKAPMRSVKVNGDYVKLRNLVINDNGEGVTDNGANNDGTEQTGLLVFNNGWNAPDREHGHGNYAHNDAYATVQKVMRNGIYVRNYEYQTKLYSQTGAPVGNFALSNLFFIGGFSASSPGAGNGLGFLIQGSNPSNVSMTNTHVIDAATSINTDNYQADSFSLTNSYWDGGWAINRTCAATVTNNVFSRSAGSNGSAQFSAQYFNTAACDTAPEAFTPIDNNLYYASRTGGNDFYAGITGGPYTTYGFTAWKALGVDTSSTFNTTTFPAVGTSPSGSATNYSGVTVNPIIPNSGIVWVWNWKNSSTTTVDVSSILTVGDQYEVIDSQCGLCGAVSTGTYAGGSLTFSLNLTSITAPGGNYGADPGLVCTAGSDTGVASAHALTSFRHATYFNSFIVRKLVSAVPSVVTVLNGRTNATQIKLEWGYAATTLDQPPITSSCATGATCTFSMPSQALGVTYYKLTYLTAGGATDAVSSVMSIPVQ